jgi:WD40 repeat protein
MFSQSRESRLASIRSIRGGLIRPVAIINEFRFNACALAISQDSQLVAIAEEHSVYVIDVRTSIVHRTLSFPGAFKEIVAISFTADQLHIITYHKDKQLCIWGTCNSKQPMAQFSLVYPEDPDSFLEYAAIMGKFSLIVSVNQGSLRLWNWENGEILCAMTKEDFDDVCALSLHAASERDWTVALMKRSGDIHLLRPYMEEEPALLYVGTHPGTISSYMVLQCTISPCGRFLASAQDGEIWIWELDGEKGHHRHTITSQREWIYHLALFPNGNILASGEGYVTTHEIPSQVRNQRRNKQPRRSKDACIVSSTLFDSNRSGIHASSASQYLSIHDPSKIWFMALAPNQKTLLTRSSNFRLLIWDVERGILQHIIEVSNYLGFSDCFAFSSDSSMLAAETYGGVRFWELKDQKAVLLRHSIPTVFRHFSMIFTTDSKSLIVSDSDGVSRWNISAGKRRWIIPGDDLQGDRLDLSSDGTTLSVASETDIRMVSVRTGRHRRLSWKSYVSNTTRPGTSQLPQSTMSKENELTVWRDWNRVDRTYQSLIFNKHQGTYHTPNQLIHDRYGDVYVRGGSKDTELQVVHGYQPVCIITDPDVEIAVAGSRAIFARNEGEFALVDFDLEWVNKI